MPEPSTREHGFARVLHLACDVSAGVGALLLLAMAATTVVSVVGRAFFSSPIQGDVELVQLGGAICIACFLPYTQYRGANIIVDFFTQKSGPRARALMDALGTALYALVLALVCWRVWAGGVAARENTETSMLMSIPIYIPYFAMLPGLALAVLVAARQTVAHLRAFAAPEATP